MEVHVFELHLQKSPSRGRPRWWLYPVLVLMALVLWAAPGLCRVAVLGGCAGPKFTAPTVLKGFLPTQECQGEKPLARLGDDDDDEGDDDVGTV